MDTGDTPPGRDRAENVVNKDFNSASLVGSFFHSFESGDHTRVKWQGLIVAEPRPGIYLVELFEWLSGSSESQCLVRIEDMLDWQFYDTNDWLCNVGRELMDLQKDRRMQQPAPAPMKLRPPQEGK